MNSHSNTGSELMCQAFAVWLMLTAILAVLLLRTMAWGTEPTCTGTTQEQTTGQVAITLCDGFGTQAAACTTVGKTGALVSASDWTELKYGVKDRSLGCTMASTATADPNANPYSISWTAAMGKIMGRCSVTTTTCCAATADCPAGQTCKLYGEAQQYKNLTVESTWTGSGHAVETLIICVENEPDYP